MVLFCMADQKLNNLLQDKESLFCLHHILFPGGQDHKGHQKLAGEIGEYSTDEKLTCYSFNSFLYFLTKFEIEVKIIPAKPQ